MADPIQIDPHRLAELEAQLRGHVQLWAGLEDQLRREADRRADTQPAAMALLICRGEALNEAQQELSLIISEFFGGADEYEQASQSQSDGQ